MANQQADLPCLYGASSARAKTTFGSRSVRRSCIRIGDGFNVVLQALPLNGKIVLRPPKADANGRYFRRAQQTIRDENDRRKGARRDK